MGVLVAGAFVLVSVGVLSRGIARGIGAIVAESAARDFELAKSIADSVSQSVAANVAGAVSESVARAVADAVGEQVRGGRVKEELDGVGEVDDQPVQLEALVPPWWVVAADEDEIDDTMVDPSYADIPDPEPMAPEDRTVGVQPGWRPVVE